MSSKPRDLTVNESRELKAYYFDAYGANGEKSDIGSYTSDVLSDMYPLEVLEWMRANRPKPNGY
jgi:hypothetical protein